jgi:hypothetical protein
MAGFGWRWCVFSIVSLVLPIPYFSLGTGQQHPPIAFVVALLVSKGVEIFDIWQDLNFEELLVSDRVLGLN